MKEQILKLSQGILLFVALSYTGYMIVTINNLIINTILVIILFALYIPITRDKFPPFVAFFLHLEASVFGLFFSIILWGTTFGMDVNFVTIGSSAAIAGIAIVGIHFATRKLTVVSGTELNDILEDNAVIISTIMLGINVVFSIPNSISEVTVNNLFLIGLILSLYAFSTVSSLNFTYRRNILHHNINSKNVSKKIGNIEQILDAQFQNKKDEVSFLVYLLKRMVSTFNRGNFERSFIDAYTIINDVTVVDPKLFRINVLSTEQMDEFRKTRAALVHSQIRDRDSNGNTTWRTLTKEEMITQKKNLAKNCLKIQRVAFELVPMFS